MVGWDQVVQFRKVFVQVVFEVGQIGDCVFGIVVGDDGLNCSVLVLQVGVVQGMNMGNVYDVEFLLFLGCCFEWFFGDGSEQWGKGG